MTYMYPYRFFAAEALKAGRVPLWNPHIYFGAPFLANLQSAVFYPPHVLFLLLPTASAMNWSVVLHLGLCAYFGYLAARIVVGVDALSAVVGGALFGLSGFVGAQVGHLNQLNAAAWLPLALVALHQALERRSPRWVAALAVVLGVQLLAGHAQESYMTVALLGGYALFRVLLAARRGVVSVAWESVWAGVTLGAGGALAAGLAAVQLLPSSELTAYSIRATGMTFAEAASFSLPPRELFVGLLPTFGLASPTSNEYLAWIGFSGLALMLFAVLFRVRRPMVFFLFTLALISFMLALGDHFPVYQWAFKLPGVRLFRVPARWLMLTTFADAMLAAAGLAFVRQLGARGWMVGSGVAADAPSAPDAPAGPWQRLIAATRLLLAVGVVGGACVLLWPLQQPGPGTLPAQLIGIWLGGAAVATALSFWALAAAPSRVPGILFTAAIFGELFAASRPLEYNNPNPPSVYTESRPVHDALARAATSADRYVSIAATGYHPSDAKQLVTGYEPVLGESGVLATLINTKYKEILTPNLPMVYGFRSVDGYDGGVLPLRRYVDFKRVLIRAEDNVPDALLRDQLRQMPTAAQLRALGASFLGADSIADVTRDGVYFDRASTISLRPQESVTLRNIGLGTPGGLRGPVSRIGIITSLEGGLSIAEGEQVATVTLRASGGGAGANTVGVWQSRLIAGYDTAEGAYANSARHRQPPPLNPAGGGSAAATYLALLDAGTAYADSVVVHNLTSASTLRVHGLTLIGDGAAQWSVSLAGGGELSLVHRSDVKLYRDERPLPRAYVVPRAVIAEGLEPALGVLRADGHDPRQVAVVERAPFVPPPSAGLRGYVRRAREWVYALLGIDHDAVPGTLAEGAPVPALPPTGVPDPRATVRWLDDSPERVSLQVTAQQGGLLVLRDTFYPGWSVTVDGKPAAALRADVLFRAIPLPSGGSEPHDVTLTFRSLPFERGIVVTSLAVFLTAVLAAIPRRWVTRFVDARAPRRA
jgi:hypothetical protein